MTLSDRKFEAEASKGCALVAWHVSHKPVAYRAAETFMAERALQIAAGEACELVWLLEHDPVYTAGTSASRADLLNAVRFPVFETGRGGQYTYHGPGQRVVYVMLDLRARGGRDVRGFVSNLQSWLIATLALFGISGEVRESRVGVWVRRREISLQREDKIAAIGIRLSRWVSLHGLSLNVSVDLSHYDGIVACGVSDHGVTSFEDLGVNASMDDVDRALQSAFCAQFNAELVAPDMSDRVLQFS